MRTNQEHIRYADCLVQWLDIYVRPTVKQRTFEHYRDIVLKKIVPRLGDYPLEALSPTVLQAFAAELCERYAVNTVLGIISVLKNSLKTAHRTGVIDREYSCSIKMPKACEKEISCFSVGEQKKIEQAVLKSKKDRLFGIVLCLYTGLRVGELMALKWEDIDFQRGVLSVNKTCRDFWKNGRYIRRLDTPKTLSSKRMIPIPKQLVPRLRAVKTRSRSAFVISGKDGKDVSFRSYQKSFERLLRRENIPHKGFHALRHTFATRAIECGMDVKTLSEILGHKNAAITLNRYAHSLLEHKQDMMNRLGKLLQQKSAGALEQR